MEQEAVVCALAAWTGEEIPTPLDAEQVALQYIRSEQVSETIQGRLALLRCARQKARVQHLAAKARGDEQHLVLAAKLAYHSALSEELQMELKAMCAEDFRDVVSSTHPELEEAVSEVRAQFLQARVSLFYARFIKSQ
jgi:hypothetical protein